jgi:hypothetical protein
MLCVRSTFNAKRCVTIKVRDTRYGKVLKMPTVRELKAADDAMLELLTELNRARLNGKLKQRSLLAN